MRNPRPGTVWSAGRLQRRGRYQGWIRSKAWLRRRSWWLTEWRRRYGSEPVCAVCGRRWTLQTGDLHHRSYVHLGQERFEDLIPLDRDCHEALHQLWDRSPAWRALGREHATAGLIALLRRLHQEQAAGDE